MENLYEVLEKSNKDLTTEQFSVYIHNILENSKNVLSEEKINSLIDGSVKLFTILAKEEMQRCDELNTQPCMTIDTYDFLQEHKEIQVDAYTSKQLEEMAEIDKKFKQLGKYKIAQNSLHTSFYIDFDNVVTKKGKTDHDIYSPFYPSPDIYTSYIKTFEQLKNAKVIIKGNGYWKDTDKLKWDGENFVPYEKHKINIDEAEKIVQNDFKEACQKSYKESIEKHAVSGNGYKADIKIESDKAPEDTANEVKKAIDQYFKDLCKKTGINFNNFQVQTEKAVKQDVRFQGVITIKDKLVEDKISDEAIKLKDTLLKYIDKHLEKLSNAKVHIISLEDLDINSAKELDERIKILVDLRDKISKRSWKDFLDIAEKEIIEALNKFFYGHKGALKDFSDLKREIGFKN